MQKETVLYILIALLTGFIGGFILANALNRTDYSPAGNQSGSMPLNATSSTESALSPEEIRAKIAEADQNPENFAFQKDLGLSLYRYGAMTQNADLIEQSTRLLGRARSLNSRDVDVLIGLGNAEFVIGFYRKDLASFEKARGTYSNALEIRPDDPDVQTDIGISYFVQEPPDYVRAEEELKKVALKAPRHERSLQFLVQVYTRQKRIAEAQAALEKLRGFNPSNPAIKELSSLIASADGFSR